MPLPLIAPRAWLGGRLLLPSVSHAGIYLVSQIRVATNATMMNGEYFSA